MLGQCYLLLFLKDFCVQVWKKHHKALNPACQSGIMQAGCSSSAILFFMLSFKKITSETNLFSQVWYKKILLQKIFTFYCCQLLVFFFQKVRSSLSLCTGDTKLIPGMLCTAVICDHMEDEIASLNSNFVLFTLLLKKAWLFSSSYGLYNRTNCTLLSWLATSLGWMKLLIQTMSFWARSWLNACTMFT